MTDSDPEAPQVLEPYERMGGFSPPIGAGSDGFEACGKYGSTAHDLLSAPGNVSNESMRRRALASAARLGAWYVKVKGTQAMGVGSPAAQQFARGEERRASLQRRAPRRLEDVRARANSLEFELRSQITLACGSCAVRSLCSVGTDGIVDALSRKKTRDALEAAVIEGGTSMPCGDVISAAEAPKSRRKKS